MILQWSKWGLRKGGKWGDAGCACVCGTGDGSCSGRDVSVSVMAAACTILSAKINISYSILFNLTTSYSSYFGGKKGISRNKTSFFLLMMKTEEYNSSGRACKGRSGMHACVV